MENKSDQPVLINHNLDRSVGIPSLATVYWLGFPRLWHHLNLNVYNLHLNVYCVNKYFNVFLIALFLPQI